MVSKSTWLIFCLISVSPGLVSAHGEDMPGPHGGVIRMPGAFHTELKQVSATSFNVYLLDVENKSPKVENSTLKATLKRNQNEILCVPKKNRFSCSLPKNEKFKKGDEVQLLASRDGMPGGIVSYPFPFKTGH